MAILAVVGGWLVISLIRGPEVETIGTVDDSSIELTTTKGTVASVTDGDTLRLRGGDRVRLVQIDAPELDECFGQAATDLLTRLAPRGTQVFLNQDPKLDSRDDYGRLLVYVFNPKGTPINLELVRIGAAVPYFFRGKQGRYAASLTRMAKRARSERRGLWGACPGAKLDPNRGSLTGPAA